MAARSEQFFFFHSSSSLNTRGTEFWRGRDIYSSRRGTLLQKRTILTRGEYLLQVDADEWRHALGARDPEIRIIKETQHIVAWGHILDDD